MPQSTTTIREDFDRNALLSHDGWDHNAHYHGFLLKHLPPHCTEALDIGCGTGAFSRLLAAHARHVLALDLSPQMIRIAWEHSRQHPNIDFLLADALEWPFPAEHFDCVVSIATLHHLPLETMLAKMRGVLKSGGVLLVLDLFKPEGLANAATDALAVPTSHVLKLIRNGRLREPRVVQAAWAEHGQHDVYPPLAQVRHVCRAVLPRAKVRRHLLWRYSIIWTKLTAQR